MRASHDPSGKSIMLVDGYGLAFRAFHALPETLATASGEVTNAVYGFSSMLLDALGQYRPDYVIVCFDVGKTFRHEAFDGYKAHRAPMPDSMRQQMDRIFEVLEALNVPVCTKEGYEADDVIGTLAREGSAAGMKVLIVTGDSDLLQLAEGTVQIVLPGRQRFGDYREFDRGGVEARYGFEPERIPEYKALVGDTSDNIPGVPGIGQKTATTLIQTYPSLETMHEHLDEIKPPRARASLEENYDQALAGRDLATIVRDLDLDVQLEECVVGDYDRPKAVELFRALEFRTLAQKLPESIAKFDERPTGPEPGTRIIIRTSSQLDELVEELTAADAIALDVESTSVDQMLAELVGISFATTPDRSFYIPLRHDDESEQLAIELVRERLRPILANPETVFYTHHGKYDAIVLERAGFPRFRITFDTMIAAYLLGETALDLKSLAFTKLGMEMTEITELIGRGKAQTTMDKVDSDRAGNYAAADVEATYRLEEVFAPRLAEQHQQQLFDEIEIPLIDVLIDMEEAGIAVDVEVLQTLSRQLAGQLDELEHDIYREAKHDFNINSTRQLGTVLFDELGLPRGRKTKTGYSVGQEVLEGLRHQHPIVDDILEYRQLLKLKSTYVDSLPAQVNPYTGRIHTSYNQTIAATGRLSSTDPNLQNIPVRTDVGRSVRRAFIADNRQDHHAFDEEAVLVSADYGQIELRLMAHMSGDETLRQAFNEGKDIHAATAADVYGIDIADVTPDLRRIAKSVNFGIMYGMQAYGLSRDTGMSRPEAQQFIDTYMARLPGVRAYLDETKQLAARQGYVSSLFGRRRYVGDITSSNYNVRQAAERMAINMPLQGTAADIMKIAMIQVRDRMRDAGLRSRMLLQVHDELVFETPLSEIPTLAELVCDIMTHVVELSVPLEVDVKAGPNWDQLEPL